MGTRVTRWIFLYPAVDDGSRYLLRRHCTLGTEYEGLATTGPEPNTSRTEHSFVHCRSMHLYTLTA